MGKKCFLACFIVIFLSIDAYFYKSNVKNFNAIFQGKKLSISADNFGNLKGNFLNNSTVLISDSKDNIPRFDYLGKFIHLKNLKGARPESNSPRRALNIEHKKYYVFANYNDTNKIIAYLNDAKAQ